MCRKAPQILSPTRRQNQKSPRTAHPTTPTSPAPPQPAPAPASIHLKLKASRTSVAVGATVDAPRCARFMNIFDELGESVIALIASAAAAIVSAICAWVLVT